jgi:glycine/D-amino acid oxidase-like deaminating enzyme
VRSGYDFVIAGGGVVGASVAFHLAELSDASVALLDRGDVCGGGTGRSCAIIRSHYSVASNTALTLRSLDVFRDFREALGEDDVACGFVNSGYLILFLTVDNKMYFRPADGGDVLAGTGDFGDPLEDPDRMTAATPRDLVSLQQAQLEARVPAFAGARLTDSWVGPYDITPDWNPVLGPAPGLRGLYLAYGFSGHGFKMAPAVGRCIAQSLLGEAPDVDLEPYRAERFEEKALLLGAYGAGSIS